MTSEPQEIGSGKSLAASLPEVELAVILCRTIESFEHHSAQLRIAIYELVRAKLRKEVCRTHPPINLSRSTLALESAIQSVETSYSRHDEVRALRSLHQLVESSEIGWSEVTIKPRGPMLIIDQPAAQTAEANHRPNGASLIVERLLRCYEERWSPFSPLRLAWYSATSARSDAKPRRHRRLNPKLHPWPWPRVRESKRHSRIGASLMWGHRR